jgi:amidase
MQVFLAEDLKYVYSPAHAAVGHVAPGETFTIDTSDCFTGRYRNPADFNAESAAWVDDNLNPVTGPIWVNGAVATEAVEVRIDSITVTTPAHVVVSRAQALSPIDWWHEEDHALTLPVSESLIHVRPGWTLPIHPLVGCLATAPRSETILSRHEGAYGGNLDCPAITAGATVILPVEVDGALLYFGDCKAAMGAGEVLCAPEVGTRIIASATPVPRPASMGSPRVRTSTHLTTIVSGISLADACRQAVRQLKLWLEDEWRLAPDDAAVMLGIAGHCGVSQVSNAFHTATCTVEIALLPPER